MILYLWAEMLHISLYFIRPMQDIITLLGRFFSLIVQRNISSEARWLSQRRHGKCSIFNHMIPWLFLAGIFLHLICLYCLWHCALRYFAGRREKAAVRNKNIIRQKPNHTLVHSKMGGCFLCHLSAGFCTAYRKTVETQNLSMYNRTVIRIVSGMQWKHICKR